MISVLLYVNLASIFNTPSLILFEQFKNTYLLGKFINALICDRFKKKKTSLFSAGTKHNKKWNSNPIVQLFYKCVLKT